MSLTVLFEPELVTLNSIPYSLCPCLDCRGVLTLGVSRRQRPRPSRPTPSAQSRCYHFTTRYCFQADGANDGEEELDLASHSNIGRDSLNEQQMLRPKVRFLPPPLLKAASQLSLTKYQPSFANPFSEGGVMERKDSNCSGLSSLLRRPAFSTHRDTLARLVNLPKPEVAAENEEPVYTTDSSAIFQRPGLYHHRDTLARLHFQHNQTVALPPEALIQIGDYLSAEDYKSLRLTCRQWTDKLPHPKLGTVNCLPNEIILQVLELLSPTEYDAARHVCKNWFSAGLDYKLATNMLKYSGSYPAFSLDLDLERQRMSQRVHATDMSDASDNEEDDNSIDEEWLMSKRLATEARLSASWRGSGIRSATGLTLSNFSVVDVVDFRRLFSSHYPLTGVNLRIRTCTVSACGSYLLLIVGCEILVYSLREVDCQISPVVRIVACRKVLAISMDTSSGRYAVAALLEGRLGCTWDLKSIFRPGSSASQVGEPMDLGMRTDVQGLTPSGVSKPIPMQMHSQETTQFSTPTTPQSFLGEEGETIESLHGFVPYRTDSPDTMSDWIDDDCDKDDDLQYLLNSVKPSHGPVDIITRPTGLYANLGTSSDTPRSVAICPQRKCVAFGCRTGIELHWIDHATATSFNR